MKYIIPLFLILILVVAGYRWWSAQPHIDATDKVHADLYENASGVWDPTMDISAFERAPTTQLTLRWQPPQETYNHFVLSISKTDGTLIRTESGEHNRWSLDPDGLEPATEYIFALQACLDPQCSAWLIGKDEYHGTTQAVDEQTEN